MSWKTILIDCIKEMQDYEFKYFDISDAVIISGVNIGMKVPTKDEYLEKFEEQIQKVIDFGFFERFLVESLVDGINKFLENTIKNHGQSIIIASRNTQEESIKDFYEKQIQKLTDPDYVFEIRLAHDLWNRIVNERFSYVVQRNLETIEHQEALARSQKMFENLTEEEKNMTFRELREKGY